MNMSERVIVDRVRNAFIGCEQPEHFTEHEPDSCWQCADAEHTLRRFAKKLGRRRFFVRLPGADLLFLNVAGFKFLAPHLVDFALSGLPGSDELMTDVVEWCGLNALEYDKGEFNRAQKEALKDFALSELIGNRGKFVKFGFDESDISELKRRWRCIHT